MGNLCTVGIRFSLVLLSLAGSVTLNGQQAGPSTLPLVSLDSIQYLGGFRLPAQTVNGDSYAGGGMAVAFNPAGNSLFVSSYFGNVAEVSIPQPVNSPDPEALPFASFLQPFADPTEGRVHEATFGYGGGISSLLVYNNRLYGTAQIYYDASNEQRVSHYSRALQLNQPSFSGWSQVWEPTKQGYVSGFLAAVPAEWQAPLGGAVLAGGCCVPIVSRTSFGPSAFAFDPMQIGKPAVSATPSLYYDGAHQTLGEWMNMSVPNEVYNQSIEIHGMVVVAGTRTVLYLGRNGTGVPCYGNGTANKSLVGSYGPDGALYCYDLSDSSKGTHAWPYRYQIWAYDLNDFAAVKAGVKQPWDVVPYGVWPLTLPTPSNEVRLGGASYDAATQTLYVAQRLADVGGLAYRPIIHAFHLAVAPPDAGARPTVSEVTLHSDKASPQPTGAPITFTAQPTDGVAPYQYRWLIWDGTTVDVAADWTTADHYTWTPTTPNGDYRVGVWVRSAGNTTNAPEAQTAVAFPISPSTTAGRVTAVGLVANRAAPQPPFTPITWTAAPVGGVGPYQYKWLIGDGPSATVAANWSPLNAFVWTPSSPNTHRISVWVRSAGNGADAAEATASHMFPIVDAGNASPAPVSTVTLSPNKVAPQTPGTTITWTAAPSGGTAPFVYKWFVSDGTVWSTVANWASSPSFSWTPAVANAQHRVRVWVKRAGNSADQPEAVAEQGFVISASTPPVTGTAVTAVTLTANKPSPQPAGSTVVFTATALNGVAPLQYQWWVFDGAQWTAASGWVSINTLRWQRNTPGTYYQVSVRVRSAGSTNAQGEATATVHYVLNDR
jgi:hypothetical protein